MTIARPPEDRFWPKVDRSGGPDACWPWTAHRHRATGYGMFQFGLKDSRQAHRVAFALSTGTDIPIGMKVLHSCDNRPCCNPAHLRIGTQAENVAEMVARGRVRTRSARVPVHLEDADKRSIRARYGAGGVTQQSLASEYGVSQSWIAKILRGS